MNPLLPQPVSMHSVMARRIFTCMTCDNIIASERLEYSKCFCSDLCRKEFGAEERKEKDAEITTNCAHCLSWIPPEDLLILPDIKGHRKTYYFCNKDCQKTFEYLNRKEEEVSKTMAKCENCSRYFLPHQDHSFVIENGKPYAIDIEKYKGRVHFCSISCAKIYKSAADDRMREFMNAEQKKEPVLKLPRLTISDLFSLDNEEEFTRYLNDIIKEKQ